VDLATLARLAEEPGDLAGFGPVVADIARKTALAAGSWTFTVTDPDSGEMLATGVTRRRPTAAQARRVMAEQPICTFPGCLMPARSCDLDHRIPYAEGGPTSVDHLAPVCRHDHGIRLASAGSTAPDRTDGTSGRARSATSAKVAGNLRDGRPVHPASPRSSAPLDGPPPTAHVRSVENLGGGLERAE
jgi:hypothetical protein